MQTKLTILLIVFNIIFMLFIYSNVKRNKIILKYALLWWTASLLMIICALLPDLMKTIANFMGIETASNMIFLFVIGVNIIITFALTVIVSNQKTKITILVEEVGLLKEKTNSDR